MQKRVFKMLHKKCINGLYPLSNVKRFDVPFDKIPWSVEFPEYNPTDYTSSSVFGKIWADPEKFDGKSPRWNEIDEKVNRKSYMGDYSIGENGFPLNPVGRTGIKGRGRLGRWGPNHAADPIVTRWKRKENGTVETESTTRKPILQFVGIQRRDCGEWAIPGGMVDSGESISATLKREFMEETMNALEKSSKEVSEIEATIESLFSNGVQIYKGYVDDPRNTDNSWMETCVTNFHDENGDSVGKMKLGAGDDATDVRWIDINKELKLYASHAQFVGQVVDLHKAHW